MESFGTERRFPRLARVATVLYAGPRESGRAQLCDISRGGLGVQSPTSPLEPGQRLPVTLMIGLNCVGPLAGCVVWADGARAGIELDWADPAVSQRVLQAMRNLEPLA